MLIWIPFSWTQGTLKVKTGDHLELQQGTGLHWACNRLWGTKGPSIRPRCIRAIGARTQILINHPPPPLPSFGDWLTFLFDCLLYRTYFTFMLDTVSVGSYSVCSVLQGLELEQCLVHSSSAMQGILHWSSSCSLMPSWDLPCLKPWVYFVLWWLSFCCLHSKGVLVITYSLPPWKWKLLWGLGPSVE